MTMYEVIDMEYETWAVYCEFDDKAAEVAAAIAYNKYYNTTLTMAQLVKIFAEQKEYKTICIKEIYII